MKALKLWALAAFVAACANAAITLKTTNPYESHSVYVNPTWAAKVTAAISSHPDLACKYQKVATYPSYIWLDKMAMLEKLPTYLDDAKAKGQLIQLVIYDLPNRDCNAAASNGELSVASNGLSIYKSQYIDEIKKILDLYPTVPMALLIEPDSLPNLVTNMNVQKCSEAKDAYLQGIAYAISKLAASNRWMYIDMGHECWLGWTNNQNGWITVINQMLALATDTSSLRGFATNTANYQNVHKSATYAGCGDGNPIYDDATYVKTMSQLMYSQGVFTTPPQFIIDTARNGADDPRKDTSQWCNIKNTGIGKRPALGTTDSNVQYVDAFTWSKPPGESDGTSNSTAQRYDYHCGSTDSLSNAPQAGEWFDEHFQALVQNAVPPVVCDGSDSAATVVPTGDSSAAGGQTPSTALPGQTSNPYALHSDIFLDPVWVGQVEAAIKNHKSDECLYRNVAKNPSFIWLDKIAMIDKLDGYMASAKAKNQLIQLVIYDLPNRDCNAAASNGELSVADDGLNKYKTLYIDPISVILNKYPTVPTVLLIEPDSLPNLVTNMAVSKCSQANDAYRIGIAYAISKLAASNRWMYIDMGHECWLGWTNNQNGWITVIKDVLSRVTDTTSIRGFATNTANYQNVHKSASYVGCGDGNTVYDDASYVSIMSQLMYSQGVFSSAPQFIIDTGRNGANDPRKDTSQWCNIKNTGIGKRPALGSTDSQVTAVDAFTWSKPPGQSDGTSDSTALRYDYHCGSSDSLSNAPQAGEWFDDHFAALVKNAVPAFSTTCDVTPVQSETTPDDDSNSPASVGASSTLTACIMLLALPLLRLL